MRKNMMNTKMLSPMQSPMHSTIMIKMNLKTLIAKYLMKINNKSLKI